MVEALGAECNLLFTVDAPAVATEDVKAAIGGESGADEGRLLADDRRARFTARIHGSPPVGPGGSVELAIDPAAAPPLRSQQRRRAGDRRQPCAGRRMRAEPAASPPSAVGRAATELETPALVVDLDRLESNLTRVADYAGDHELALFPHLKTHKTVEIARRQLDAGAAGLTVAKSEEAALFARELGAPLVLHYPIVGAAKVERVARVASEVPLTVAVDSLPMAEPLATELRGRGIEAEALIELDVGLARTGVATPAAAAELAAAIDSLGGGLAVAGLSCYPGHLRHGAADPAAGMAEVAALLAEAIELFDRAGLSRARVSGGSTATLFESHRTPITELRPGNYALLDRAEARGSSRSPTARFASTRPSSRPASRAGS